MYPIFVNTTFCKDAIFSFARFHNIAVFTDDKFDGGSSFFVTSFDRSPIFEGSSFARFADFRLAFIHGNAFFEGARFDDRLSLNETQFNKLFIRWSALNGHLDWDESTYIDLIDSYNRIGWSFDADDCYYDYRKRMMILDLKKGSIIDMKPWNWLAWLLYGFGVRPAYPLVWSAFFITAFGLAYWRGKGVRKMTDEGKSVHISLLDAINFSARTFTTERISFLTPHTSLQPTEKYIRISIAERVMGYAFLTLFAAALWHVVLR